MRSNYLRSSIDFYKYIIKLFYCCLFWVFYLINQHKSIKILRYLFVKVQRVLFSDSFSDKSKFKLNGFFQINIKHFRLKVDSVENYYQKFYYFIYRERVSVIYFFMILKMGLYFFYLLPHYSHRLSAQLFRSNLKFHGLNWQPTLHP